MYILETALRTGQSTDWLQGTYSSGCSECSGTSHVEARSSEVLPFKLKDRKFENSFLHYLQEFLLLNAPAIAKIQAEILMGHQKFLLYQPVHSTGEPTGLCKD